MLPYLVALAVLAPALLLTWHYVQLGQSAQAFQYGFWTMLIAFVAVKNLVFLKLDEAKTATASSCADSKRD
jgi:hypothetical protein